MSEPKPNAFSVWFNELTPDEQQAWRDKLAAVPRVSHADCSHAPTQRERKRCRRARERETAKAAREAVES